MKALTICQPYPELILCGEKPVENRKWPTRYRGPLVLHAGKSRAWLDMGEEMRMAELGRPLVFGALVGVADLVDCLRVEDIEAGLHDQKYPQLIGRAHCGGPFCWVLTNPRRLPVPIPWRGSLGLFQLPDEALAAIPDPAAE